MEFECEAASQLDLFTVCLGPHDCPLCAKVPPCGATSKAHWSKQTVGLFTIASLGVDTQHLVQAMISRRDISGTYS